MNPNVGRRIRASVQQAVADAERAVEAAAEKKAREIQLEITELEETVEEGFAGFDRRLTNIESRDAEHRRAQEEKSKSSIVAP